jgi:hypothetical protein
MKRDGRVEQVRQLQEREALIREQVKCQMKGTDRQAWAVGWTPTRTSERNKDHCLSHSNLRFTKRISVHRQGVIKVLKVQVSDLLRDSDVSDGDIFGKHGVL